ncbi:MAG TPA: DUF5320 domain-containing protein [Elusimicrobiales bacterium]|nr:DUF5320 domain-containing protein [Elusimicrobiales bacterium]
MPGGDGTGPLGAGPMGWGRGPCGAGFARGARRWAGQMGYGRGRGFGGVMPIAPAASDAAFLKQEAELLKARLAAVEKELNNSKDGNAQ